MSNFEKIATAVFIGSFFIFPLLLIPLIWGVDTGILKKILLTNLVVYGISYILCKPVDKG